MTTTEIVGIVCLIGSLDIALLWLVLCLESGMSHL